VEEFGACWEALEDPRTGNAALHDLHDLLMIALCTVLSGGENATDMAEFAKAKEPVPSRLPPADQRHSQP
jgi:DDE_Tnp_1-associated